jgi:hypothetical protein
MHIAGDSNGCDEFAEQLVEVSARYDFPVIGAVGSFMLGAALALRGDFVPALKQMEPLFEVTFGYGFFGVHPGIIMAQTFTDANRNQEALTLVTRLLDGSRTPETGVFVSELWRLRGELLLRQSAGNSPEAERYLGTAVRIASEQGAVVLHLRASISLARLLAERGRRDQARTVLDCANANRLDEWDGSETTVAAQLRSDLH